MSSPSPTRITLPRGKPFQVTIDNDRHFPPGFPGLLVFSEDVDKKTWVASFSVPLVGLTQGGNPISVIQKGQYEFNFVLNNPTQAQQDVGYIAGTYNFRFDPPGADPTQFGGSLDNPWPGDVEDNWTAEGDGPDK